MKIKSAILGVFFQEKQVKIYFYVKLKRKKR